MVNIVNPARKPVDAVVSVRPAAVVYTQPSPVPSPSGSAAPLEPESNQFYQFSIQFYEIQVPGGGVNGSWMNIESVTEYNSYGAAQTAMAAVAAAGCPVGAAQGVQLSIAGVPVMPSGGGSAVVTVALPVAWRQSVGLGTKAKPPTDYPAYPPGWTVNPNPATPGVPSSVPKSTPIPEGSTVSVDLDRIMLLAGYVAPGRTVRGTTFRHRGQRFISSASGDLMGTINPATGTGALVGAVDSASGHVSLHDWTPGNNDQIQYWSAYQARPTQGMEELPMGAMVMFRTIQAPLRPESLQVIGTVSDGVEVIVTANANGYINHSRVKGQIDYESGVGWLLFTSPVATGYGTVDLSEMGLPGVGVVNVDTVLQSTLRYNAVAYEFIPVDPAVSGVDSVRLPSDGLVPIFVVGDFVVLHRTVRLAAQEVVDGQDIHIGAERVSRISIVDANGDAVTWGWARDLDAGTVKILTTEDWAQPVHINYSIEFMARVRALDINGRIELTRALTHNFPAADTYISSCLMLGDRFARVSHLWDQQSWDGATWVDFIVGNAAVASYNDTISPIEVDNIGALTQRWIVRITSLNATTGVASFEVIGQNVGRVATGTTNADCEVKDPLTGIPWMTIRALGWGAGWAVGNCLRINTVGAMKSFCVARAIQPGEISVIDDDFEILARVDVDRPGAGD